MKETIVLIHGFAEDARIWENLLPSLQDYHVLAPNLPGSGDDADKLQTVSMDTMAEFIHELLVEKNIGNCTIIGHSMGGYIALAFAEKYPEKLNGLGLFHSTAFADSDEKKLARKKNIEFIRNHGTLKFLQQSVPKLFSEEYAEKNPGAVKDFIHRYRNFSPDSLVDYTAAMMERPDRLHVLKSFTKPVLFIMGEHDTAVPIDQGLKQCSVPEFSYIYIATHSGHLGMIEEPEFCVKAVEEFLSAK